MTTLHGHDMLKNDYTIKERKADEQVKVQKGRLIKEIIIVLLCMVLGSALIELGANIRSIGKGNQSTVVPDESITLEGFVREGGGYYLQSGEGVLRCELNGEYLKKFIYDFDTKDLVDAKITVGYDNSMGKEETVTIEDRNPILLTRSVVNVGKRAKWLQISLSNIGSGILIRNIEAGNSFELNKYRIFSSNILILGICLLVIFRKKIGKEIEYGFAVIALALGIVFVISIPTNKIGWDEETHFKRAYEMSLYPGEEKVSSEIAGQFRADTFYNYPYFQPQSYEEKQNLNGLMNYYYKEQIEYVFYDTLKTDIANIGNGEEVKKTATILSNLAQNFDMYICSTLQLAESNTLPVNLNVNDLSASRTVKEVLDTLSLMKQINRDTLQNYEYSLEEVDTKFYDLKKEKDPDVRYYACVIDKNRAGAKPTLVFKINLAYNIWEELGYLRMKQGKEENN